MKLFSLTSSWTFSIACFALLAMSGTLTEADPTDDFSMILGQSSGVEAYRLMPEKEVVDLLEDRLDLFPKSQVPRLARHIVTLCKQYRFDPAFILSLIEVESRFRVKAISPVGAVGLMQIMPATANFVIQDLGFFFSGHENFGVKSLRKERELRSAILMEPFVNTAIGIAYLAWLRDHYKGVSPYVLAAYNAGPAKIDELLSKKNFKPDLTKTYFQAIRNKIPKLRFYQAYKPELNLGKWKRKRI